MDLINKKFGRLTVIKLDNENKNKRIYWICKCSCGNIKSIRQDNLTRGKTLSCGCLNKEIVKKYKKEYRTFNKYQFKDDYVIGYTTNGKFIFDKEDYDKIKNYKWNINTKRQNCVQANINHTTVKLHRLILNCKNNYLVDHINGDERDNRRINLRICNNMENSENSKTPYTNKSGHKGVFCSDSRKRYEAYIKKNGKRIRKTFYYNTNGGKENSYKRACEWVENLDKNINGKFSVYNRTIIN